MGALIVKAAISGILIAIVNLVAQRSPGLAGLAVAFPAVTLISLLWLWADGVPALTIETFLAGVAWGLVPTFVFVLALVLSLRASLSLVAALVIGAASWAVATAVTQTVAGMGR